MRALFEIDFDIENCFDIETGEIFEPERLEELQIERERKLEGIGLYIKNLTASAEAIKNEEQALKGRREVIDKRIEGLKRYLTDALEGNKMETARIAMSFRRSQAVSIIDESLITDEYKKVKTEVSVDKTKIKSAIKLGMDVPGAVIIENVNLQIK